MRQLFWQKYQANSLFTFMKSKDFDKQTLEHVINSTVLCSPIRYSKF